MCFFVSKTSLVFKKYPKISTGVNPEILIQCRPNIFALFKKPKILTSKILPLVFGVKNMVLMKYPKILTGAKPKISIRCKPNISVLFKSHKILTSKSRAWVFLFVCFFVCVKNMVLMKYPKILTGVLLDILKNCRPKIFVLFKNPKILTSKIGHGFFGVNKHGSYEIPQDVERC